MTEREPTRPVPNRDGEGIPTGVMQENTRESKTDISTATKAFVTELLGLAQEIEQTCPQSSRVGVLGRCRHLRCSRHDSLGWMVSRASYEAPCV
jgi:hypothetical protein